MSERHFLRSPYRTGVTLKKRDNSRALSFLFIMPPLRTELSIALLTPSLIISSLSCVIRVTIPVVFFYHKKLLPTSCAAP
jgi:hypothetical protein